MLANDNIRPISENQNTRRLNRFDKLRTDILRIKNNGCHMLPLAIRTNKIINLLKIL